MAASRGRGLRPGGVVRTLGRLCLLIGFGFAAGLLIGVLSEEPELLAGHLRGEGESVVLVQTEVDGTPGSGALSEPAIPREDAERSAVMEIRPEETPDASLPVVAARAKKRAEATEQAGSWAIQVGAFEDEASAVRLADGLGAKGYPTELLSAGGDSPRWRVRVQPLPSEAKAKEIETRLKHVEHLPTWVLPVERRSR